MHMHGNGIDLVVEPDVSICRGGEFQQMVRVLCICANELCSAPASLVYDSPTTSSC